MECTFSWDNFHHDLYMIISSINYNIDQHDTESILLGHLVKIKLDLL